MIQQLDGQLGLDTSTPPRTNFANEVVRGLQQRQKRLACKFFYDARGSALFEQICRLPEYYLTRTELGLLTRHVDPIAEWIGPQCLLVEYGSGGSIKTRQLLDRLQQPAGYIPIDISGQHLLATGRQLTHAYPHLEIRPLCADYTGPLTLPAMMRPPRRTVAFFPGSTVGNFTPREALQFLKQVRALVGPTGGLLIGVDLKKDPRLLHAAYNDAAGVTAAFNLNLLVRLNRELGADFQLERFAHYACYNAPLSRVEMHLVSLREQSIHVAGHRIDFAHGESIFTESSYKYAMEQFTRLTAAAGYTVAQAWQDPEQRFSVQCLQAN